MRLKELRKSKGLTQKEVAEIIGYSEISYARYENEKRETYHYISKEALEDMHDLNVTHEHFNWGRPICVISRRVYDYLTEQYPRTHYFPFFLKE